jgi:hypothetical protein
MHELIGAHAEAQRWVRVAKARHSGIAAAAFMAAFPIRDETMRTRIVGALKRLDL